MQHGAMQAIAMGIVQARPPHICHAHKQRVNGKTYMQGKQVAIYIDTYDHVHASSQGHKIEA